MIFLQENVVGVERPWPEAVRRFHTSRLQILDFVHQCVFSHFPLITTFLNLYYLFFVAFISSASKTFTSVSMKWKSFSRTQNQICLAQLATVDVKPNHFCRLVTFEYESDLTETSVRFWRIFRPAKSWWCGAVEHTDPESVYLSGTSFFKGSFYVKREKRTEVKLDLKLLS